MSGINWLNYIIRFTALVLIQVLVLNNVYLHGYINPYIYPIFILLLPVEIPHWLILIIGMFLGLTVGMFTNSPGIHAAATTFIAFIRPYLLNITSPQGGYEDMVEPRLDKLGFTWFLVYTTIMIMVHHLVLLMMEAFDLAFFFVILPKVFFSSVLSITLTFVYAYLFQYKK